MVPLVKRILIYDFCLLTLFHLATQCVESIPDDYACEGFRHYIVKGKKKKFIGLGNAVTNATLSHRIAAMSFKQG